MTTCVVMEVFVSVVSGHLVILVYSLYLWQFLAYRPMPVSLPRPAFALLYRVYIAVPDHLSCGIPDPSAS